MFKKLVVSSLLVMCMFALSLYLLGVRAPIHLSKDFLAFLNSCSHDLEELNISIPNIPSIPYFDVGEGWLLILNFFIAVVNGLSGLINFIITLVNVIINIVTFLFILLRNFITSRDIIVGAFQ